MPFHTLKRPLGRSRMVKVLQIPDNSICGMFLFLPFLPHLGGVIAARWRAFFRRRGEIYYKGHPAGS